MLAVVVERDVRARELVLDEIRVLKREFGAHPGVERRVGGGVIEGLESGGPDAEFGGSESEDG